MNMNELNALEISENMDCPLGMLTSRIPSTIRLLAA